MHLLQLRCLQGRMVVSIGAAQQIEQNSAEGDSDKEEDCKYAR